MLLLESRPFLTVRTPPWVPVSPTFITNVILPHMFHMSYLPCTIPALHNYEMEGIAAYIESFSKEAISKNTDLKLQLLPGPCSGAKV